MMLLYDDFELRAVCEWCFSFLPGCRGPGSEQMALKHTSSASAAVSFAICQFLIQSTMALQIQMRR